jgi:hypothetical protein
MKLALKNQKFKVPKEELEKQHVECVTERKFTKRGYNRLIDKKNESPCGNNQVIKEIEYNRDHIDNERVS